MHERRALRARIPALVHSCILAFTCILAFSPPLSAQNPDRAATEALARRTTDRMRALQQEADRLTAQEKTLLVDLRKLEIDRQIKVEQARELDADAAKLEADLSATTTQLANLEADDAAARPELRMRLVEMYKLGQGRYARLWLSTADLRRIGEASRTVAALAQIDRDRVAAHQRTLDQLRSTRASLEQRRTRLDVLRVEARQAQAEVERAAAARSNAIRNIDRQRDLNAQLAGELQGAQQKLQAALRSLAPGPTATAPSALHLRAFRGELPWPASGTISRRFTRPEAGQAGGNGIEIAAPEGSAVVAVYEGVVAYADAFTGFGNLVIVDHGSQTFSLYGNLAGTEVKKGARIQAGQAVGSVGLSPAGPAGLYFELRVDGQAVDPLQWLKKR